MIIIIFVHMNVPVDDALNHILNKAFYYKNISNLYKKMLEYTVCKIFYVAKYI